MKYEYFKCVFQRITVYTHIFHKRFTVEQTRYHAKRLSYFLYSCRKYGNLQSIVLHFKVGLSTASAVSASTSQRTQSFSVIMLVTKRLYNCNWSLVESVSFLFYFYEPLLVKNHWYEIWRKSVPWESRIPGTEGVDAKSVLQREPLQRALPFEYFKPLNAASDNHCITSCSTGSSRLSVRLSMSEFVLQNRIWIRL